MVVLFFSSESYLHVSHTGCGRHRLLGCLCFPSRRLVAMLLLRIGGNICAPILAQQDAGDFRMAFQPGMDQRTLATLISVPHLATEGNTEGPSTLSLAEAVIHWPRSVLFISSLSQNRSSNCGDCKTRAVQIS